MVSKKEIKKYEKIAFKIREKEKLPLSKIPTLFILITNAGLKNDVKRAELESALASVKKCIKNIILEINFKHAVIETESVEISQTIMLEKRTLEINTPDLPMRSSVRSHMFYLEHIRDIPLEKYNNFILPNGLTVINDFLTVDEHYKLINFVESEMSLNGSDSLRQRAVIHYGYDFNYNTNGSDSAFPLLDKPIPMCFMDIIHRVKEVVDVDLSAAVELLDQCTVNVYEPGQGIPAHTDTHSAFGPLILTVSLGSPVTMDWYEPRSGDVAVVRLEPRCLCLMGDQARYLWRHAIAARKFDDVFNQDGAERVLRHKRISLTFRSLKYPPGCNNCLYLESCDLKNKSPTTADAAILSPADLERLHVHAVYDGIADHFSATRHSMWPRVRAFIEMHSTPEAIGADVGCGNGKYLPAHSGLWLASDPCEALCRIASSNKKSAVADPVQARLLALPYRDGVADFLICIAVLHHLSTHNRRLHALAELVRLLRVGGCGLVYVWARDQAKDGATSHYIAGSNIANGNGPSETLSDDGGGAVLPVHKNRTAFSSSDMLVPWTKKTEDGATFTRYYHLFEAGELEHLCASLPHTAVRDSWYDSGNYAVVLERLQ